MDKYRPECISSIVYFVFICSFYCNYREMNKDCVGNNNKYSKMHRLNILMIIVHQDGEWMKQ